MEGGRGGAKGRRARAGREKEEKRRSIGANPRTLAFPLSFLYPGFGFRMNVFPN